MPIQDLELRVLNGFFGIVIAIISVFSFFNLDADLLTLLVILIFGIFNCGVINVSIGVSDTTQDTWARILEIVIGVFATLGGIIFFFITLLIPPSTTDLLEMIITGTFFIIGALTVIIGFFETNTKREARLIMGIAGFIIAIISVLILPEVIEFTFFISVILLIYGTSRIFLGIIGLY